jgi:hypothetical protein
MAKTAALPRPTDKPILPAAETPVAAAVRRIGAKLDAQHAEIARLLRVLRAALT